MPLACVHRQSAPGNVSSGDYTITVTGTYACGNTVQPFAIDPSLGIGTGRFVLLRSLGGISLWVGATVDLTGTGRTLLGVSRETVNYSGTNYDCVVVTLG